MSRIEEPLALTEVEFDPFAGPALVLTAPATEAQREIWAASLMGDDASCAYNESNTLRLLGPLDVDALRGAFQDVVQRHEALRTTFSPDGATLCVAESVDVSVPLDDLAALAPAERQARLDALLAQEVETPFDLERGPLIRARIVRLGAEEHWLVFTAHHLVCDGWSTAVLVRDLAACYTARCQGVAPALGEAYPFSAYARERAAAEATPERAADEAWWLAQFAGPLPTLDLPLDGSRPPFKTYRAGREDAVLDAALVAELKQLATRSGASFFTVLLAGFDALLYRLAGAEDLIVGVLFAGQATSGHSEFVGHCVNTLPIRCAVDGADSFQALLGRVRTGLLDASEHAEYTFGSLVQKLSIPRDPSRLPLVSVLFNLDQGIEPEALQFAGLAAQFHSNPRHFENFELFLNAVDSGCEVRLECQYNSDLFEASTVRRWLGALEALLRGAAARPEAPVAELPLLTAEERATLARWNETAADYPRGALLHELVEQQVARTPEATAVVCDDGALSYATLDRRANQLARRLRALGVGPNVRVGLCLERSLDLLVALLAINKAGGAYLPLDAAYPAERLAFMLEDARVSVLVTEERLRGQLPPTTAPVVSVDGDRAAIAAESDAPVARAAEASAEDLAYIIYTSGSTGKPKGVLVPQRAVVNFLWSMRREPGLSADDALVAVTTLSFDIAGLELWLPLLVGARIVLASRDTAGDGAALLATIERERATVMQATPATWRLLIGAGWEGTPPLKVLCGGEALPRDLAEELVARSSDVWNLYGPTETTIWSTCQRLEPGLERVLIGRPIANTRVHVLDERLQPVPIGVPGELYIGGDGVTLGYHDRPELTAERFIVDPFTPGGDARLYRTGDLVRFQSDGSLEYFRRNDTQVKVRGYRIELGEIETILARHPAVAQAVTVVREDRPGDVRLVAYVVTTEGATWLEDELRTHLRQRLPDYMVPQHFVALAALPLTPNGKVDRKALPAPEIGPVAGQEYVAPRNDAERLVAELWQDALGIGRLGIHDDFFQLGGHSLLAARVVARLARDHGIAVPLRRMFEAPTIARFAPLLDGLRPVTRIPRLAAGAPKPASIMQRRLWFLDQLESGRRAFSLPAAFRLRGALDVALLERSLQAFIERQEATRTTLAQVGDEVVQVVAPALPLDLTPIDLSDLPEAEREAELMRRLLAASDEPFDLAAGPLMRVQLFRLGPNEHVLFLLVHHAIWDGWSFDLFVRDLDALYAAFREGKPSPLPELPIQYSDFAAWHHQWLEGAEVAAQASYWWEQLADQPDPLELPTDRPRPRLLGDAGATEWIEIPREEADALTALGRREGATLFMVLLAAYETLLHRFSGQDDILIGTPVRGRAQPETEDLAGFFVNTVVLRARLDGDPTFLELLRRVRATVLDAFSHEDVPFEFLQMSRGPAYRAFFSFQDARGRPTTLGDLALSQLHVLPPAAANDVGLWIMENDGGLVGGLNYSTELFEPATIKRMLASFRALLRGLLDDPARPISRLAVLPAGESTAIRGSAAATDADLLHAGFERQVDRDAAAPALLGAGGSLTYGELDARANGLARRLRALGVGPQSRVAVCAAPGLERAIATVAVAKASGVLVPLDPAAPAARRRRILADASPAVVLSEPEAADALADSGVPLLLLADAAAAEPSAERLQPEVTPADVAVVWYTAGSAGEPVGVELTHEGLASGLAAVAAASGLTAGDRLLATEPAASGRSVLEMWLALTAGAAVILAGDDEPEARRLRSLLERFDATAMHASPWLWEQLCADGWTGGDHFLALSSGEPLSETSAEALASRAGRAFSLYGLAETGFWSGIARLGQTAGPATLGEPLAGGTWYVVDKWLAPVPHGVPGELLVGGTLLARGYAGQPAPTDACFVPDPFAETAGARLCRTGDRVRVRSDGSIEYLGRLDDRGAIRGLRVDPLEVERALAQHRAVREAAAAWYEHLGERRLVAFVVADPDEDYTDSELRRFLRKTLPEHLVPRRFVELSALPRGVDGRVERARLPIPTNEASVANRVEPRTDAERFLAGLWQDALGIEAVSVHDNFFDVGGHSLLCLQTVAAIERRTGKRLSPRLLLLNTLEQVAAQIDASPVVAAVGGAPGA